MVKKGRKELNPADAYRKEQRKKEIKKNKKDRKRTREWCSYIKDPGLMKTEVRGVRVVLACTCCLCAGVDVQQRAGRQVQVQTKLTVV